MSQHARLRPRRLWRSEVERLQLRRACGRARRASRRRRRSGSPRRRRRPSRAARPRPASACAASASARVPITVSPAPVTSATSSAVAAKLASVAGVVLPSSTHMPCSPRVITTDAQCRRSRSRRAASRASSSVRMRACVAVSASTWFGVTSVTPRYRSRCGIFGSTSTAMPRGAARPATTAAIVSRRDDALEVIGDEHDVGVGRLRGDRGATCRATLAARCRRRSRSRPAPPAAARCVTMRSFRVVRRSSSVTRSVASTPPSVEQLPQRVRGLVVAHHADQRHRGAERREVHGDVGGAAGTVVVVVVLDDRDRGFGRSRCTRPNRKWSSITSPTTTTRRPAKPCDDGRARRGRGSAHRGLGRRLTDGRGTDSGRSAANGSVSTTSRSIRNSESPKLYSNRPAPSMATSEASAPRRAPGSRQCGAGRGGTGRARPSR